jgi:hypothetical protein
MGQAGDGLCGNVSKDYAIFVSLLTAAGFAAWRSSALRMLASRVTVGYDCNLPMKGILMTIFRSAALRRLRPCKALAGRK